MVGVGWAVLATALFGADASMLRAMPAVLFFAPRSHVVFKRPARTPAKVLIWAEIGWICGPASVR